MTTATAKTGRLGSQPGLPFCHDEHVISWRRLTIHMIKLKLHAAMKCVHELAFV